MTAAVPERPPDRGGWYNHAVAFAFAGVDVTSGVASCTSLTYSGPDGAGAAVSGTCKDTAGNSSAASAFGLKYDATPPQVTEARPIRGPDEDGWYNHPVDFTFKGADDASGVGSCTTLTYSGPDGESASVTGTCSDHAGNSSDPGSFPLKYDTTPPTLGAVTTVVKSGVVTLRWQAPPDSDHVVVLRVPGKGGQAVSAVYRGTEASFQDRSVENEVRYRYTVSSFDQAGNRSAQVAVRAIPSPLYLPGKGALVASAPLLAWAHVPKAGYYNVQLFRGAKKILSTWPGGPRFQLRPSWSVRGRRYRLTPGVYRWYVWPGFGARSKVRYGELVGKSKFVVSASLAATGGDHSSAREAARKAK